MKQYKVIKKPEPFSWSLVEPMKVLEVLWLPESDIRMEQKLCYDEGALYVYQTAHERFIRSKETGLLCSVCQDSCMEFFFRPEQDDRYLNIEINPGGFLNCGFGKNRKKRFRIMVGNYMEAFHICTNREEEGWSISYRIPLDFLQLLYPGLKLEPGLNIYANCYKCGDKTVNRHYLSWNRVTSDKPDFHRPEDFGHLIFG